MRIGCLLLSAALLSIAIEPLASAQSSISTSNVSETVKSDVDNRENELSRISLLALRKEIELQRFNVNYRLNVAKQGRWKGLRYFLSQETNAALSASGGIIGIAERYKNFNSVSNIRVRNLETGNILSIAGQSIGAAGSGLEFAINVHHHMQAKKKGFSTKDSNKYVRNMKQEIDTLLARRALLLENLRPSINIEKLTLYEREGLVLDDIRDLALAEYVQFVVGQTSYLSFQQSLYLLDIARNTTGALGNLFAYISNVNGDPTLNTEAGIFFTTNGALTIAAPLLSRTVGYAVRRLKQHSARDITDKTVNADVATLCADVERLKDSERLNTAEDETLSALIREGLYESQSSVFLKQLALRTREVNARNLAATENITSGTAIGATKLAAGVNFVVAGVRYSDDKRRTNVLISTAGTVSLVGTAISLLDNIRIQVRSELVNRKLSRKKQLPGQVLADRLAHLEAAEAAVEKQLSSLQ